MVAEEAGWYEVTEEDIAPCLMSLHDCPRPEYNHSYAIMLLPFYSNRIPYDGLGVGELMSYFTRRVLSTKGKDV